MVRETQEVKRLRPAPPASPPVHPREPSELDEPGLAGMQFQVKAIEPLRQVLQKSLRVAPVLKAHHEIVRMANDDRVAFGFPGAPSALEPQVENVVQGVKQCRDATVLLVNGIPLVIAEYKSYVTSGDDWLKAVRQLHRYQRQAPMMLAPNVFCVAADEYEFRYGTVLFHDAGEEDVKRHVDQWGRWLSLYPDHRGWWNEPEAEDPDDPLETPVKGLLRLKPAHVLDFLQHFVVFETKSGATKKKIAR